MACIGVKGNKGTKNTLQMRNDTDQIKFHSFTEFLVSYVLYCHYHYQDTSISKSSLAPSNSRNSNILVSFLCVQ